MTMAQVRMRFQISGGRGNTIDGNGNIAFTEWPGPGEILECGEQEAAELIRGGMADPVVPYNDRIPGSSWERETYAPDDGGFLPVPATTPAAAARTEPAADSGTQEKPRPVRTRTAPRKTAATS